MVDLRSVDCIFDITSERVAVPFAHAALTATNMTCIATYAGGPKFDLNTPYCFLYPFRIAIVPLFDVLCRSGANAEKYDPFAPRKSPESRPSDPRMIAFLPCSLSCW